MLGFQAFSRGALRMAARVSVPQMSTFMPKHISYIHQYVYPYEKINNIRIDKMYAHPRSWAADLEFT